MIPRLAPTKYRPDIDGLRAIAILAVVVFHAFPSLLRGGFIGVDVFFVISGFLISSIIFEGLDKGTFSFAEFYAHRIRRIFPSLLFVLITLLLIGWLTLLAEEYKQLSKHIASAAGFFSNFILWNEVGYFDNSADTKPLLHLWSLGIEEQAYIIWPLVFWLAWKRKINTPTLIILGAFFSFYLNLEGINNDAVATFYAPQTRIWELLTGSLLAWLTLYKKETFSTYSLCIERCLVKTPFFKIIKSDGKTLCNISSIVGTILLIYGFWGITKEVSFPGKWAIIPVLGATLIISAGPNAWINRTILSKKIIVSFGLISFPLYLWHWPILSFATIIEGEVPDWDIRLLIILISVVLAWLTFRLVEQPIRLSKSRRLTTAILILFMMIVGCIGYYIYAKANLCEYRGHEDMFFKRKGFEHGFGCSLSWYEGKNNWLFLGNTHRNTVAKLKLSIKPTNEEVDAVKITFSKISEVATKFGTKMVLIVAPDKSSIYPEYLPDKLTPSKIKYISFFLKELNEIPNLTVYDPTHDLLTAKKSEGILYWRTDSHWNNKGAFLTFMGFSKLLDIPIANVSFKQGGVYKGGLIEMSNLKYFPLHPDDNWDVIWNNKPALITKEISGEQKTPFGPTTVVTNNNALSNKYVWVIGDSFTENLRQYFSGTFREVRFIGHWRDKLNTLPDEIERVEIKPDIIVVIKVERSF